MPFTIEAADNEFAAATGSNVDTTSNSSRFDNPPQGSKDLRITTKADDDDPRLFEIGDTYDVTFGGNGGSTILDAVVVRSDAAPGGPTAGVVVFEGLDENGDIAQVIWTPNFDIEGWYQDNFNPSAEPRFYTEDTNASYDYSFVCFASETHITTPDGSKSVGTLKAGDLVTTKDAGDVVVQWVGHRICPAAGNDAPVVFEQGALGNSSRLRLSQQHRVLVTSPFVQYYFGTEEAFVQAKACVNDRNIHIVPEARICYVHVLLENHHIVWAEGLECETLFMGDQATQSLYGVPELANPTGTVHASAIHDTTARPVLKAYEAQVLMEHVDTALRSNTADDCAANHAICAVV